MPQRFDVGGLPDEVEVGADALLRREPDQELGVRVERPALAIRAGDPVLAEAVAGIDRYGRKAAIGLDARRTV